MAPKEAGIKVDADRIVQTTVVTQVRGNVYEPKRTTHHPKPKRCHQTLHRQTSTKTIQQLQIMEINNFEDAGYICIPTGNIIEYKNKYIDDGRITLIYNNKLWIK